MMDVTGKRRAKSIDIFAMILTVMTDQFYVFYNNLEASGRCVMFIHIMFK